MRIIRVLAAGAMAMALLSACGSSGDGSEGSSDGTAAAPSDASDSSGDAGSGSGGGAPGTLTIDGEEIALGAGRCLLEPQPSAGGGGTIELTAQASGTNADGEEVVVDFTRYSDDSDFAGDDVSVTIGDPFSGDAIDLRGSADAGAVTVEGSEVSATDFSVGEDPTATESISFVINC